MELSLEFQKRIRLTFGQTGIRWLNNIDTVIEQCAKYWHLNNIRSVEKLSYNLVCFAEMSDGREVILKAGVPSNEFLLEAEVIRRYRHPQMRRLIDCNDSLYAMLLEKIDSDIDLCSLLSFEKRIAAVSQLVFELLVPVKEKDEAYRRFPKYQDWTNRAFSLTLNKPIAPSFRAVIGQAGIYLGQIDLKQQSQMLLHGDLHHMNILRDTKGWMVIDPKGVIGALPVNCARFIENELDLFPRDDVTRQDALDYMLDSFGKAAGAAAETIFQYLYIDMVLSTCWFYGDGEETEAFNSALKRCYFLETYRINKYF